MIERKLVFIPVVASRHLSRWSFVQLTLELKGGEDEDENKNHGLRVLLRVVHLIPSESLGTVKVP